MNLLELVEKMSVEVKELEKTVKDLSKPKDLEEYVCALRLELYEDGTVVGKGIKIWDFLAGI